ncbi:hypothetical protein HOV93_46840 [Planctomycetes bacterium FF15]|uniref:Uncharacterized protein n=1 Tax=Bremerella alba TaxID=980252 RepID=A0A7V9A9G1_9BACT|nr:hypothetical protein [Bremerella alba]
MTKIGTTNFRYTWMHAILKATPKDASVGTVDVWEW